MLSKDPVEPSTFFPPPPFDLHWNVLSLCCPATFFDGSIWIINSKLSRETKPTISEESDCASFEPSFELLDRSSKSTRFLLYSWPARTLTYNANYQSLFPSTDLLMVLLKVLTVFQSIFSIVFLWAAYFEPLGVVQNSFRHSQKNHEFLASTG